MRINAINSQITPLRRVSGKQVTNSVNNGGLTRNVISMSDYMAARTVSFGKKDAKQDQVIFIGAESAPWSKKGGVGTVMQDYRDFGSPKNQIEITPYYKAGKDDSDNTIPLQDDNGYYMKDSGDKEIRLVKVAEKEMQWGKLTDEKIMLFKKQSAEGENACPSYFVFVDDVSNMKVPYESGHNYRSGAKAPNNGWNGDPYAKYSKAAVELLPDIIADVNKGRAQDDEFNPATIVCSDSQTAYVYEYMAQHAEKDKNNDQSAYYGIHPTYVGHNLGPGYCGETSMRNMFVNLGATPEQIKKIEEDLMFQQNILGDKYFEPLVKEALDANGNASAVMIPIHYTQKGENATANGEGYGKMFTVVAEDYAESLATNPQAANNIYPFVNKMREQGVFDGILNPLNDPKLNPTKPVPNAPYTKELTEEIDGKTVTYPAFEVYPENPTYEQMRQVKNTNKARLLRRLSAHNTDIIGPKINGINSEDENKTYPLIREDLIQKIENGEGDDVPVFVSWGRCDTQKGHDITLNAFKEFAKTPEGKNAILLLGAGLEKGNPESQKIEETVAEMLKDEDLKGRIVHIDGWAPGYAFASAADYAIFASRFEPCGLTDLEAMKYYCTPIVTNTQGFKQKNFDPRIDAEKHKATSLRTQHEYNLLAKEHIQPIIDGYVSGNKAATAKVKKEFPLFKDANGKYDDKLFKEFATSYKAYTEGMEKEETDWDKMSKDFNFQYGGFARTLKDGILIKELADALKYSQSEDGKQNRTLMYENQKALDTSWEGNEKLHPSGKSSAQLYRELHMQKDYSQPQAADLLKTQSTEAVDKLIIERQNGDLKGRVENYASGSLVGGVLAFLGATLLKKNGEDALKSEVAALKKQLAEAGSKAAEQASDALNDRIKELESQLEKQATNFDLQQQALQRLDGKLSTATNKLASKNKAMVAVGIGAAVVGGVGTYFAAKYISKKKAEKANENQAPAEQTKPAEEVKAPETSAPAQATTPEVKDVPRTTNILQRHISMNDFAKQA